MNGKRWLLLATALAVLALYLLDPWKPSKPSSEQISAAVPARTKNQDETGLLPPQIVPIAALVDRRTMFEEQPKALSFPNAFEARLTSVATNKILPLPITASVGSTTLRAPVTIVTPAAAPITQAAPVLPFKFLGKKSEGGVWEVYLFQGDKTYIARYGDTLDGQYRVTRLEPPKLFLKHIQTELDLELDIGEGQ